VYPSPPPRTAAEREEDDQIIGDGDAMRYVMSRIDQVAPTDATVLLYGETGTGKELVARALHRQSPRRDRPFVVVNCAAMPAPLIESELFGRERGAFTGAHATQIGRFELANRGTIFLDEIGELPLEVQPRLLRVLQEGQVERLGNPRTVEVDVRVVAATNRDLAEEVRAGRFRRDLYYRLNVFPITLPALAQRREDIPALVRHLVERLGRGLRRYVSTIPDDVMAALQAHDWPGNVRELENVLQRAIILSKNGVLTSREMWLPASEAAAAGVPETGTLVDVERRHIVRVLSGVRWRIEGAGGGAQILGLKPSTLRSRMVKLGIERPR
jgi:transcriptional regulator with GAF, ATPase, and Fis domain